MKCFYTSVILGIVLGLAGISSHADTTAKGATSEIVLKTLLKRSLAVAQDTDVIVDRVTLPPNATLSRRWHPGEMFIYVMEGDVVLSEDGRNEIVGKTGDLVEVPFKQVYAARTNGEGAQVLLFRVHKSGRPIRTLLD